MFVEKSILLFMNRRNEMHFSKVFGVYRIWAQITISTTVLINKLWALILQVLNEHNIKSNRTIFTSVNAFNQCKPSDHDKKEKQ